MISISCFLYDGYMSKKRKNCVPRKQFVLTLIRSSISVLFGSFSGLFRSEQKLKVSKGTRKGKTFTTG